MKSITLALVLGMIFPAPVFAGGYREDWSREGGAVEVDLGGRAAAAAPLSRTRAAILRYVEEYNAKAAVDALHGRDRLNHAKCKTSSAEGGRVQPDSVPWTETWRQMADELEKGDASAREEVGLVRQIASHVPDRAWATRMARMLRAQVDVSYAEPNETFNAVVADMLADYYENPRARDALYHLLGLVSKEVKKQPAPVVDTSRFEGILGATMVAMIFIAILNARFDRPSVVRDGTRGLITASGNGFRRLVQLVRGAGRTNARGTAIVLGEAASQARVAPGTLGIPTPGVIGDATGAFMGAVRGGWGALSRVLQGAAERYERIRASNDFTRRLPELIKIRNHGWNLAGGIVLASAGWGAYEWNRNTGLIKVDPAAAMEYLQAMAILDLEARVLRFNKGFAALFQIFWHPAPTEFQTRLVLQSLDRLITLADVASIELAGYEEELAHFNTYACEFKDNVPLRDFRVPLAERAEQAPVRKLVARRARLLAIQALWPDSSQPVSLYPISVMVDLLRSEVDLVRGTLTMMKRLSPSERRTAIRTRLR